MKINQIISEINRREFLKRAGATAVAGAGAVIGYRALNTDSEYEKIGRKSFPSREQILEKIASVQASKYQQIKNKIINPKKLYDNPQELLLVEFIKSKPNVSKAEAAQFLAQCDVETNGFTSLEEDPALWESPERFFSYYTRKLGVQDVKNPSSSERSQGLKKASELINSSKFIKGPLIANFVYANVNGNGPEESGDGWKYRGMGLIHLTGRANYLKYAGLQAVKNPDLLLTDWNWAVHSAIQYWNLKVSPAVKDWNNTTLVTKLVNSRLGPIDIKKRHAAFLKYLNLKLTKQK